MTNESQAQFNRFLENLAETLDIAPSKYQQAVERYRKIGLWLKEVNCEKCFDEPRIYPQGSFRLGTVVRPIREGKESDYDIDIVCQLQIGKNGTNPKEMKKLIGDRLNKHGTYRRLLKKEGRRCWTLDYAEEDGIGFHIDILPSIPENESIVNALVESGIPHDLALYSIAITEKEDNADYSWNLSNPEGFANWFDQIKKPFFEQVVNQRKKEIFEKNLNLFANVDEVPDQLVKTPLQRAIQILKRHRDMRFIGHKWEEDKPISMIITTLSARLYKNEPDVYTTLKNIIEKLKAYNQLLNPNFKLTQGTNNLDLIKRNNDGTWYIPNPVNPGENFADRWRENEHRKARVFFQWIEWVETDIVKILKEDDLSKTGKILEPYFGERIINEAFSKTLISTPTLLIRQGKDLDKIDQVKPSKPWSF